MLGTSKHLDRPDVSSKDCYPLCTQQSVNGTHITRVIKTLTQNVIKKKGCSTNSTLSYTGNLFNI